MPLVYDGSGNPIFNQKGQPVQQSVNNGAPGPVPPPLSRLSTARGGGIGSDRNMDPRAARMDPNGLLQGGIAAGVLLNSFFNTPTVLKGVTSSGTIDPTQDWRVRLTLPDGSNHFYNDPQAPGNVSNMMLPIISSGLNGVVWPYTPSITVAHNARYQEQALTHSNYKSYFYEGSDVAPITIAGDWSVQNIQEGEYLLSCIWFLRAATKMFWGSDTQAGTPPVIVYLDGYGQAYFPHVSCIITNFTHTMPSDVDYVALTDSAPFYGTRVPTLSQLSVTVQPVYSRSNIAESFNVDGYASGASTQRTPTRAGFL